MLPRLTGLWTHLSKQKGGIGMRGPGETEIETDRRIVRDRISLLKDKIKTIDNFVNKKNNLREIHKILMHSFLMLYGIDSH